MKRFTTGDKLRAADTVLNLFPTGTALNDIISTLEIAMVSAKTKKRNGLPKRSQS